MMNPRNKIIFFLVLTCWSCTYCLADSDNDLISKPQNLSVEINGTAIFGCKSSKNESSTLWSKFKDVNNTNVIFFGKYKIPKDTRYKILQNNSLVIEKVQLSDAGYYNCKLVISKNPIDLYHYLNVIYAPTINISYPNKFNVEKDQEVQLECHADGNPTPNITWKHNDKILDTNNSVLKFNAKSENSGQYICDAVNKVGEDRREYLVDVRYRPKVIISEEIDKQNPDHRLIICSVRSNPEPTFQLFKDSNELSNPVEREDIIDTNNPALTVYKLSYRVTTEDEYGVYICKAENQLGTTSINHTVTKERPSPPAAKFVNIPSNNIIDANFELKWQVVSDHPIISFELTSILLSSQNLTPQNGLVLDTYTQHTTPSEDKTYSGSIKLSFLKPGSYKFNLKTINSYNRSNESEVILNLTKSSTSHAFGHNVCIYLFILTLIIQTLFSRLSSF